MPEDGDVITSFIFRVRNVPAALYKALGGFATNNVNMTKLESYQPNGFLATQFYADIEGHPGDVPVRLALEELNFYCSQMDILGATKPRRSAPICAATDFAPNFFGVNPRRRQRLSSVDAQSPCVAVPRWARHHSWRGAHLRG